MLTRFWLRSSSSTPTDRPCSSSTMQSSSQDDRGALAGLLAAGRPHLLVIAAGRPDVVRSTYGHWTAAVRRSRKGLLLGAVHDLDGDVLGVLLPRRGTARPRPGDGLLVIDGTVTPMQIAMPCG